MQESALVWTGKVMLEGRISRPPSPAAVAIFASAPSLPDLLRDEHLIAQLEQSAIATLYIPLLTEDELQFDARTGHFRHDAEFLAQRFIDVAQWLNRRPEYAGLPVGYIGTSGGAAAAIVAATYRPDLVRTVVSIDGRTDLAVDALKNLRTPALLIVRDMPVLRMNREALTKIRGDRRIEILHGEETNVVEQISERCVRWMEDKVMAAMV